MTDMLRSQVEILVNHSLNSQGAVDLQLVEQTIQAFRSTRAAHKSQILRLYKQRLGRLQRHQQAVVTSSRSLTDDLQRQLTTYIAHTYPQAKAITWQVDPDLIGGFTILVGDMWHDSSVAHDLQTIREQLSQ